MSSICKGLRCRRNGVRSASVSTSTSRTRRRSRGARPIVRRRSPHAPSTSSAARPAKRSRPPRRSRPDRDNTTVGIVTAVKPKTLDHVAFWVADREPIVELATSRLGMHVIDRQDAFTLIGSDARRGKLTLFTAEGPREQGAFKHVALRVSDLERATAALPSAELELGEGVRVQLVEAATDVEYDLDHVALVSADPEQTAKEYTEL